MCHSSHVKVREIPEQVLSLHYVCHQGLYSGHQTWQEVLLLPEQFHQPLLIFVTSFNSNTVVSIVLSVWLPSVLLLFLQLNSFKEHDNTIVHVSSILLITEKDGLEGQLNCSRRANRGHGQWKQEGEVQMRNSESEDKLRREVGWEMGEGQEWRETNLNNRHGVAEARQTFQIPQCFLCFNLMFLPQNTTKCLIPSRNSFPPVLTCLSSTFSKFP